MDVKLVKLTDKERSTLTLALAHYANRMAQIGDSEGKERAERLKQLLIDKPLAVLFLPVTIADKVDAYAFDLVIERIRAKANKKVVEDIGRRTEPKSRLR